MSLTNKVAQFDADSDLVNHWVHDPSINDNGDYTTITTNSGSVRTLQSLVANANNMIASIATNSFINTDFDLGSITEADSGTPTSVVFDFGVI